MPSSSNMAHDIKYRNYHATSCDRYKPLFFMKTQSTIVELPLQQWSQKHAKIVDGKRGDVESILT